MSLQRTTETLTLLEQAVCESCGDLKRAAMTLQVNLYDLVQWMNADPHVDATIKAAQRIGWASLESYAYKRAVLGVKKAVYYKGDVVGYERQYSDGLLAQMMKARVPGYGDDGGGKAGGVTVNVAIMPRASNYEEWLEHKETALKQIEGPVVTETVLEAIYPPADEEITEYVHCGLPDVL